MDKRLKELLNMYAKAQILRNQAVENYKEELNHHKRLLDLRDWKIRDKGYKRAITDSDRGCKIIKRAIKDCDRNITTIMGMIDDYINNVKTKAVNNFAKAIHIREKNKNKNAILEDEKALEEFKHKHDKS